MKHKDGKLINQPNKHRSLTATITVIVLCGFSFYLGVIFKTTDGDGVGVISAIQKRLQIKPVNFPECGNDYQDYTPCIDPKRWRKYGTYRLTLLERHFPPIFERKECLIPPPAGYKPPIRWPKSRDECWYRNVPYDWFNKQKSNQLWLKKEGEKFLFPGGGTMFPNGVGEYVDLMQDLIPGIKDGSVRTAIDTGCGEMASRSWIRLKIPIDKAISWRNSLGR